MKILIATVSDCTALRARQTRRQNGVSSSYPRSGVKVCGISVNRFGNLNQLACSLQDGLFESIIIGRSDARSITGLAATVESCKPTPS